MTEINNIFNFDSYREYPPADDAISNDFSLIYIFLKDLPHALRHFTDVENCNLLIIMPLPNNAAPTYWPTLFQRAYDETFYNYDYLLSDVRQRIQSPSTKESADDRKQLHSTLRDHGLTGNSLKLKWNMLQNWWQKFRRNVSNNFADFRNIKLRSIFMKLMFCLNSILGSLMKIFALDSVKEFKEMLESANDLVGEPD
ncbi:MAG: hypothetical protein ACXWCG_13010 [Flavitalea sp.]